MHVEHLELMELVCCREDKVLAMCPFHCAGADDRRRRAPHLIVGTVVLHHKHTELLTRIGCPEFLWVVKTQIELLMRPTHVDVGIGKYGG